MLVTRTTHGISLSKHEFYPTLAFCCSKTHYGDLIEVIHVVCHASERISEGVYFAVQHEFETRQYTFLLIFQIYFLLSDLLFYIISSMLLELTNIEMVQCFIGLKCKRDPSSNL